MSQKLGSWSPLSCSVLISVVLHGGIVVLLSLKPRVVTLTIGSESGLMRATLVTAPTDNDTTGRSLKSPEVSQHSVKQHPPRSEKPPRLAEKPPVKSINSAKSSVTVEPSKESMTDQRVNAAQATSPRLKRDTSASTKKNAKMMPVKGEGSSISKSNDKTASTKLSPASAMDLDHFFGQLATSPAAGNARGPSTQQCNDYATQIKSAIQANLIKEQGYQGKRCEIALQLAADGTIVRAEARQGDGLVCAAALRAVGITERVPKPPNPALYELFKAMVISFEF